MANEPHDIARTWSFIKKNRPTIDAIRHGYTTAHVSLKMRKRGLEDHGLSIAAVLNNGQIVYYHPKELDEHEMD